MLKESNLDDKLKEILTPYGVGPFKQELADKIIQAFKDYGYVDASTMYQVSSLLADQAQTLLQMSNDNLGIRTAIKALDEAPVPTDDRTVGFVLPDGYMSGQEFYDRFEKEAESLTHYVRSLFREGYPTATKADEREMFVKQDVLEAAKKAAGL